MLPSSPTTHGDCRVPECGQETAKKRILFVDDEPHVLESLRNLLRKQRHKWQMTFVDGGRAALEVLAQSQQDVIVTDMRMPQMDGATLLEIVQKQHPQVIRVVLSGYAELEVALRAVHVAHQFLDKPCDPRRLEEVIDRTCELHRMIADERVRKLVGKIDKLPAIPRIFSQLVAALADPAVDSLQVATIIEQDMTMCAKLLQLVNSAFLRLQRRITRVDEAVAYLGFNTIKHLVLTIEVFGMGEALKNSDLSIERLQEHSLLTAHIATELFTGERLNGLALRKLRQDAFTAALLHDIGQLIIAIELPREMSEIVAITRAEGITQRQAEERVLGVTHAEVGAYLLGLWGLPYTIIEAVAYHHDPTHVQHSALDLIATVAIAELLANEQQPIGVDGVKRTPEPITPDYLSNIGVTEHKLEKWRAVASAQAARLISQPEHKE